LSSIALFMFADFLNYRLLNINQVANAGFYGSTALITFFIAALSLVLIVLLLVIFLEHGIHDAI